MKTKIFSVISSLVVVLGLTTSTYASSVNSDTYTVLNDISAITKIEIRGNVEVYVSDAPADRVKVYDDYYSGSALVQNKDGVLRIASYKAEKLVVWVSAKDLRSISAFDNAEVKSFGKLSKINFNVDLHDNATAKLDMDAFNADLTVRNHASIVLTGDANNLNIDRDINAVINSKNLAATHTTENKFSFAADDNNDLMGM
ncbi:MAG TPA: DUF2807 domain-containing protein [Mucilaginibacter sp.]|nr:DUF2807 domain-containing protein [Mucilaginibacter sp.]